MTYIANPIYDSVFKYMMEDERVAKILLSALLKKEVVGVEMKQHEYTEVTQSRISMLRLDFNAKVRDNDGSENIVLIELQKTWLPTETLRFRQYLGVQYQDKKNVPPREDNPKGYAYPIVSIYILGHKVGRIEEPVVYVKRSYLDYDSNPITIGVPDPFVESLTHDSIIVQIPYLKDRLRNRLERLLQVFNQDYCSKEDEHYLSINEDNFHGDEAVVVDRLIRAGASPVLKRSMEVEDEILSEIEARDTALMLKDQMIVKKDREIEQKDQEIEQKDQEIEQKSQEIEQKSQEIEQKSQEIEQKDQEIEQKSQEIEQKSQEIEQKSQEIEQKSQEIEQKDQEIEQKSQEIEQKDQEIEQKDQVIRRMVKMLLEQGLPQDVIAKELNLPADYIWNIE